MSVEIGNDFMNVDLDLDLHHPSSMLDAMQDLRVLLAKAGEKNPVWEKLRRRLGDCQTLMAEDLKEEGIL